MFTAVIPVYNHARYLPGSVVSALRAPRVREVLLLDDGSHDGSTEVAARLARAHAGRVRDLTRPGEGNRGAHARLNELVAAAREPFVAVLNSDDAFAPGRFEALALRLRRGGADFAFGHLLIMDARGRVVGTKRGVHQPEYPFPSSFDPARKLASGELTDLLANQNFVATTSNMVFSKALHARVGGFRPLRYVHDWDFALRASVLGRCAALPHFLSLYRVHAGNTIRARPSAVDAEVRSVFADLLDAFPELRRRRDFEAARRANPYLAETADGESARSPAA